MVDEIPLITQFRLRVVPLSLRSSCVTRKKSARKNGRLKSCGRNARISPPYPPPPNSQEFTRPLFSRGFLSRHTAVVLCGHVQKQLFTLGRFATKKTGTTKRPAFLLLVTDYRKQASLTKSSNYLSSVFWSRIRSIR